MEEENKILVKPNLDLEVIAELKGISTLENNMQEVKEMALSMKEYYKNTPFIIPGTKINFDNKEELEEIESKKKTAREEKAKVNKFEEEIDKKSKDIITEYMKPIDNFIALSKETKAIIKEVYTYINNQVIEVDVQVKNGKEEQTKEYFKEYLSTLNNIDFITYEKVGINVTLSASLKSLKEQAKTFLDKVNDDLELIDTQEHKAEILVEYKQSLNVSQAITTVSNRMKAIELEKQRVEEVAKRVVESQIEAVKYVIQEEVKVIEKVTPVMEADVKAIFTVTTTISKMKELKMFLESRGIKYESGQ